MPGVKFSLAPCLRCCWPRPQQLKDPRSCVTSCPRALPVTLCAHLAKREPVARPAAVLHIEVVARRFRAQNHGASARPLGTKSSNARCAVYRASLRSRSPDPNCYRNFVHTVHAGTCSRRDAPGPGTTEPVRGTVHAVGVNSLFVDIGTCCRMKSLARVSTSNGSQPTATLVVPSRCCCQAFGLPHC